MHLSPAIRSLGDIVGSEQSSKAWADEFLIAKNGSLTENEQLKNIIINPKKAALFKLANFLEALIM